MKAEDRYDSLIQFYCQKYQTPFDWLLVKAQIEQESAFNPIAISPAGAKGLMQLMPGTAKELGVKDPFNPKANILAGIYYLWKQYNRFPEIPNHEEKLKFSLAAYNGGRGSGDIRKGLRGVNGALHLARKATGKRTGEAGVWQTWDYTKQFLKELPNDWKQMIHYVDNIIGFWMIYKKLHQVWKWNELAQEIKDIGLKSAD